MEGFGDDGKLEQGLEGDDVESVLVGGLEDDRAGGTGFVYLQPAGGADAPAVAGLEAGKAVLRHGGGKIVAETSGGGEELGCDDAADGVDTDVVRAGAAAAVAIEARHGVVPARFERLTKNIFRGCGLRSRCHRWIVVQVAGGRF